jgi:hypothetical protein
MTINHPEIIKKPLICIKDNEKDHTLKREQNVRDL